MTSPPPPLFKPLYLKALIIILPVLIVLLASLGPDTVRYPDIQQDAAHRLYWIEQPERADNELRLILTTTPAIAPEQRLIQQTLAEVLQQQLQQARQQLPLASVIEARIQTLPDQLQLQLRWPAGAAPPDPGALIEALAKTPESDALQEALAHHRARAYLADQDPAQRLLNRLQTQLQGANSDPASPARIQQRYRQLFDQPPLQVFGGPDATTLSALLRRTPPVKVIPAQPGPELDPAPARLALNDARQPAMQLRGTLTAGREATDYSTELLAVRSLQHLLALQDSAGLKYRLVWQPLHRSSVLALILGAPFQATAARLIAPLDAELVEQVRVQQLALHEAQLQSPDGQLEQLAALAFHGLTAERLDGILEQLQQVSGDDIARRIEHYLDPSPQILITLNGQ
jgi:hypothetical protein